MKEEMIELARRHKQFQKETKLMLWLLWEAKEYEQAEANIVNTSIVNEYFNNEEAKLDLTITHGDYCNIKGFDVREVAKSYIEHFKKFHDIKPKITQ